jgi:hypothetical protein
VGERVDFIVSPEGFHADLRRIGSPLAGFSTECALPTTGWRVIATDEPGRGVIAVGAMDALLICFAAGVASAALGLLPVTAEAVRHTIERSVTG